MVINNYFDYWYVKHLSLMISLKYILAETFVRAILVTDEWYDTPSSASEFLKKRKIPVSNQVYLIFTGSIEDRSSQAR